MEAKWNCSILPQKYYFSVKAYNRSLFAGISTGYVVKQLVHAFSCAYIELWMHLGSLESTQEARVALGCASRTITLLSCSPNFQCASITQCTHAKAYEPIVYFTIPPSIHRLNFLTGVCLSCGHAKFRIFFGFVHTYF